MAIMLNLQNLSVFHRHFSVSTKDYYCRFLHLQPKNPGRISRLKGRRSCLATVSDLVYTRRSANYHPTIWDHHHIESLQNLHTDTLCSLHTEELKLKTKEIIRRLDGQLSKLQFIDSLQRLGLLYHFNEEIRITLDQIYNTGFKPFDGLYDTALCFRLLRQHGYNVSSDVFNRFRDDNGFKNCLCHDEKGLLGLYEAAHLGMEGEKALEEAKEFSFRHLKCLGVEVKYADEFPLHWRMPRLDVRHYIDIYERDEGRSFVLLELAKLDFNLVQSMHLKEVKELSRWWKDLHLADELKFSRDRLFENYFWAAGIAWELRFSKCRSVLTKLICILTVIDDAYDIYGSIDELELFTSAIKSWDCRATEALPDYLKLCFSTLYNFVHETAYDILNDCGWDVMHLIKREWEHLCEAYLKEAEWFNRGYTPTLTEYLENAWISVGGPLAMVQAYFLIEHNSAEKPSNIFEQGYGIIYWSSLITRLNDDLGTSKAEMERGDTPKSIQCHMNDSDHSYGTSAEYIKGLIIKSWMNLNKEFLRTNLPLDFRNMVLNMARTSQCIFQSGDGIGSSTGTMKDMITSLFTEPIMIE